MTHTSHRLALSAVIAAAMLGAAGAAAAQQDPGNIPSPDLLQQTLVIEGTAPSTCAMAPPTLDPGSVNATLESATNTNAVVLIPTLANAQTAIPQAGTVALSVPIKCNTAHTLTVHSRNQGLKPESPTAAATGFASSVNYTLTAAWAGLNASFDTASGRDLSISVPDAATGDASVTLKITASGPPLIAGNYSDEIVVEVATKS